MGLSGTLVSEIPIKFDGNVFHQLLTKRPHEMAGMCPHKIQSCELLQGQWGTVGSIIFFKYTHDGKECVAKEIIEAVDEEKKSQTFKVIEGDLMELYRTFKLIVHVDTKRGHRVHVVILTFEYDKLSEDVPDPHSLMDLLLAMVKDIETYHLNNPN